MGGMIGRLFQPCSPRVGVGRGVGVSSGVFVAVALHGVSLGGVGEIIAVAAGFSESAPAVCEGAIFAASGELDNKVAEATAVAAEECMQPASERMRMSETNRYISNRVFITQWV